MILSYDAIGQLTSWGAKESNGSLRRNEQLGFGYDAAENLHLRTNGALVQTFTIDPLNELTNITRAGTLTLSGATPAPATNITVNGAAAERYADFTFALTNNTLVDGQNTFTNIARSTNGLSVTNILSVNLPSSASVRFDSNANLTNDSSRLFLYDSENQLTNITLPGQWKTEFLYDGLGRRRIAKDYGWNGADWVKTNETRYIYDQMLIIQERDSNNIPLVTYTRGLDLNGGLQDLGGIGGLLGRTDANGSVFYHSDGAGNVTGLMDAQQNMVARYLYGPFGSVIGRWGTYAGMNLMQFSSMSRHPQSGLVLYPFRAYEPNSQRWLTRDPLGESGSLNLYEFVGNDPLAEVDPDGDSEHNIVSNVSFPIGPPLPPQASSLDGFLASLEDILFGIDDGTIQGTIDFGPLDPVGLGPAGKLARAAKAGKLGKAVECVEKGKPFTKAQKRAILDANRAKNAGALRSDLSGQKLVPARKSLKGVTPQSNEAQVDHVFPRSKGGQNTMDNGQVLSGGENRAKSDKLP